MDIDVAEREHLAVDELKARLAGAFVERIAKEDLRRSASSH
ncbi:hypothetical protein AB0F17_63745 [Nonomuraea sp. NPDC026600]